MKLILEQVKPVLGLLTIILVFAYLFGITFTEVKLPHDIVPQVLIAIVAFGKDIYNYFFGNSQGSAKKDDTIASLTNTNIPTIANSETTVIVPNDVKKD